MRRALEYQIHDRDLQDARKKVERHGEQEEELRGGGGEVEDRPARGRRESQTCKQGGERLESEGGKCQRGERHSQRRAASSDQGKDQVGVLPERLERRGGWRQQQQRQG